MNGRPKPEASEKAKEKPGVIKKIIIKQKEGTLGETVSDWRWIFQYTKKYRWYVVVQTIFGVIGATLGLLSSILSKYTVDIVTGKKTDYIIFMVISMVVSAILGMLFSSLQSRISTKISLRVFNDIRAEIYERLLAGEWQQVRAYHTGDIMNRLNNDSSRIASIAISWIPSVIVTLYSFASSFIAMLYYDASIALIALLGAPLLAGASSILLKKSRYYNRIMFEKQSGILNFESETFHNYDTVKSLGAVRAFSKLFNARQEDSKQASLDANMFSIRSKVFLSIVGHLVSYATFGYCLVLLWANKITYGTMTFFLTQRSKVTSGFNSLLGILPSMVQSAVSAKRVREFFLIPSEKHILSESEIDELIKPPVTVRLKSVDFGYESGRNILRSADFYARGGEIVAIVGASGQGKTTLLRLLLSLVYPQQGSAEFVDAKGNTHILKADHRRLFSYVPQGNTMVSGTIADNLRITNENATEKQMMHALECACAAEFVEKMGGLDAKIGERGHGISEGQAQRISIARAILRDAPILLLDEATSSLDADTEQKIINNIIIHNPNKTCIISTHRTSALKLADRIYRVSDERISTISLDDIEWQNTPIQE
ncbi:MAG: ABC transporter ATP-binding protein [Clostridia bacterium]|nr:ABC transporter ATP-binding protein [Clostridia bacterium]